MGDGRKEIIFLGTIIAILAASVHGIDYVYADKKGPMTNLEALGTLQLAAHDFFNVNRCLDHDSKKIQNCTPVDNENGKLDLSTLLEIKTADCTAFVDCASFSDDDISLGGEVRNRESILIFSVSSELGSTYLELREKYGEDVAYEKILEIYHQKVRKAFVETFKQPFPEPQDGDVNHNHNLALRSGHDFLPGKVKFNGEYVSVFTLTGQKFSKSEMRQYSSPLDGEFDEEFLGIDVCITPSFCINVNLLEADRSFAEQFDTDFSFDHFMKETSDGRYDKNDDVTKLLIELFARGLNL